MYQNQVDDILAKIEIHLDDLSIEEIKASIERPWRQNPKEWEGFLKKTLPSETFELSENVNGQEKSYSFSMGLVRDKMVDELLSCEVEVKSKLRSILSQGNNKVFMRLSECIDEKVQRGKSITWGELIDEVSPKGFFGKMFSSKERWEITPIRLDSAYRILWMLSEGM